MRDVDTFALERITDGTNAGAAAQKSEVRRERRMYAVDAHVVDDGFSAGRRDDG